MSGVRIFCPKCRGTLAEIEVKTAAKSHIARMDVWANCEFCEYTVNLIYGESELRETKDPQLDAPHFWEPISVDYGRGERLAPPLVRSDSVTVSYSALCPTCGGSMQPANVDGTGPLRCAACRATP